MNFGISGQRKQTRQRRLNRFVFRPTSVLREDDEGKGADSAGILFGSSRQGDWKDRRISERPGNR